MNKILLDFGANKGQGLKKMIDMHQIDDSWIIYSFEPNPVLFEYLKNNFKNKNLNITFYNAAIWKTTKKINFSIMNENDEGSSAECLISEGRAADPKDSCYRRHNNIIEVEGIDILDLLSNFKSDDFVIIKMDIEGSEFPVIRRLLEDKNACAKIKKIYIEWHTGGVRNETKDTENHLIHELEKHNIETMNHW